MRDFHWANVRQSLVRMVPQASAPVRGYALSRAAEPRDRGGSEGLTRGRRPMRPSTRAASITARGASVHSDAHRGRRIGSRAERLRRRSRAGALSAALRRRSTRIAALGAGAAHRQPASFRRALRASCAPTPSNPHADNPVDRGTRTARHHARKRIDQRQRGDDRIRQLRNPWPSWPPMSRCRPPAAALRCAARTHHGFGGGVETAEARF